jgi:hypothetical protein|tara:strand:+ start:234 stop:1595 length:1362 start_codon:yes stop_codon:yes gene_type:complete
MAINTPNEEVLKAFELEGYHFNDYLKFMKNNYPNVDPIAYYTSKGETIITGAYDNRGKFVPDIKGVYDNRDNFAVPEPFDNQSGMLEFLERTKEEEEKEWVNPRVKARAKLLEKKEAELEAKKMSEPIDISWYDSLSEEEQRIIDEDIPLQTDFFGGLEGALFGTNFEEGLLAKSGINPTIAAIGATIGTKNPKYLFKKKGMLEPVTPRVSTTKSTILKPKTDKDALLNRTKSNVSTKDSTVIKPVETVSTKNSRVLKEVEPKVSTKNSRVLKEVEPRVSTKNSRVLKPIHSATNAEKASVLNKVAKGQTLTRKEKLLLAAITTAAGTAAITSRLGNRDIDGSLIPIIVDESETTTVPETTVPETTIVPEAEVSVNARPGWYQGSSKTDTDDGNYWSADFEDEYWNTPAGVQEAINVWGRPVGSKHSWETPLGTKSQYANKQQPDWSWMNQFN